MEYFKVKFEGVCNTMYVVVHDTLRLSPAGFEEPPQMGVALWVQFFPNEAEAYKNSANMMELLNFIECYNELRECQRTMTFSEKNINRLKSLATEMVDAVYSKYPLPRFEEVIPGSMS